MPYLYNCYVPGCHNSFRESPGLHFCRLLKNAGQNNVYKHILRNETLKRKRQRTSELNEGEIEGMKHHREIRDLIETSTASLTNIGRKAGYFKEQPHVKTALGTPTCTIQSAKDKALTHLILKEKDSRETPDGEVVQHSSCSPSLVFLQDGWHILPPETSYLISDAFKIQPLVDFAKTNGLFDVVVIDPPWYNKSAKRSGKYSFMSLWQMKSLPIPQLLSHDALVVVWVTNKPKYIRFTKEELLPHWGVSLLAEWYWVKVTRRGEFVVDLDSLHKKPYETLIIGRYKTKKSFLEGIAQTCLSDVKTQDEKNDEYNETKCTNNTVHPDDKGFTGYSMVHTDNGKDTTETECVHVNNTCDGKRQLKLIPNNMVICSVPCQVHSRKPPLYEVLEDYVNKEGRFLEMFARNLTPRWTSWGNEVLKFQHIDYFEETSSQENYW